MATAGLQLLCLFAAFSLVFSDTYLHNPRGSNNRLNEASANRNNANRMFDSQNNNRGGYNVGDVDDNTNLNNENNDIYYMKYFQSSENEPTYLTIEWTNQHGCGGNEDTDPHKLNCNIVIQYMVQDAEDENGDFIEVASANAFERIHDGTTTNTQDYQAPQRGESYQQYLNRRNNARVDRGLHESFDFYDDCYMRERNRQLFTADQNLRSNQVGVESAIYTRQNPNGNRRGYECPEERDYYPYWHPTPWRDIAVLTDNMTWCDQFYSLESFNVKPRYHCRENVLNGGVNVTRSWSESNSEDTCTGDWFMEYAWIDTEDISMAACRNRNNTDGYRRVYYPPKHGEDPTCLVLPNAPECIQGGWTRVNHLGNSRDGVPLNYTWRIPYFPSQRNKFAVIRVRYNISTDDYDPWTTNSSYNDNPIRRSPVTQNPNVNIGSTSNKPLRLAINTAQFGRTFQDRTHVMELRPRSKFLTGAAQTCNIYNLNVRGKRGNIVQVYPAVEYDFIPNRLTLKEDDCLHVQWTGSNTHNNGNPAGDGQAGDAGEGTGGTDRSNIVQIPNPNTNYPLPWEQNTLFEDVEVLWNSWGIDDPTPEDLAVAFASSGYYGCYRSGVTGCSRSVETGASMNQLLNNAPASFEGALLRFVTTGEYFYICSRNNNFTNRSQKGQITVTS